ncbi:PREDICTED: senecionine N-oxygenase-like isoform X2 [Papilio polytes]|uniref:senecionine N-oxygenase-like isoform X2 n=1 Tax=Papilio polytes TaxID=76194 RepID=UPI0006761A7C|nr:PREDICTED: senecionine N-oxygenase-like isoform X2 [Papilio polytes]
MAKSNGPRVCIIGAGVAGLTSAKCLKDEGINFTVLECSQNLGGMWKYEATRATDHYNSILHTSMFGDLRLNLPHPTMELLGFPIPKHLHFFPNAELYYYYIVSYAEHFNLKKYIQFLQNVTSVRREGNVWKVKTINVLNGTEQEDEYDFIIIGTGHFSNPNEPKIPNEELFKGEILHTKNYRVPTIYENKRVLIVGGGTSAWDIVIEMLNYANTVVHSHHSKQNSKTKFPDKYVRKPDVKEFNETGAIFVDGTYIEIDVVIYCTGFNYTYPYLDSSCGLTVNKDHVVPLYKCLVNINEPSMVVLGLVRRACHIVALNAQVRYTTALIKGDFSLPSKEEMLNVWQKEVDVIHSNGRPMSDLHLLGDKEDQYYKELCDESGIDRVPPVMSKLRNVSNEAKLENLFTYRDYIYELIDDKSFRRIVRVKKRDRLNGKVPESILFVADAPDVSAQFHAL